MTRSLIERASRPAPGTVERLADPASRPQERLDACLALIEVGELEPAAVELVGLTMRPETAVAAVRLLQVCRRLQEQAPNLHEGLAAIERDPATGCWWAAPAGADTTVVAFAGAAQRIGISAYFLLRILGRLGCNTVVVFDTGNRLYLRGVPGLGSSVAETAPALRSIVTRMGGERVVCLGQSAGGFGAIRYAGALGARAILAFSPLVYATPTIRGRWLQRLGLDDLPETEIDLRAQRLADPAPPQLHIVHGALHAGDRAAAASLADLPGVTVAEIAGLRHHGSLQASVMSGQFVSTLESFLAGLGPAAR